MNFATVENDIRKLIGLELESIQPGSKITITEVDDEHGNLMLKNKSGLLRSRPLDELRRIWDQMMICPAVHVDGVLHGSGTSRNQPETILANLPYVEWLRINNKKHISYVGESTHAFGTLKKMDSVKAAQISCQLQGEKPSAPFTTAIVSKDVNRSISVMQSVCQGTVSTLDNGIYQMETATELILFISADSSGIEEGTYCVISSPRKNATLKRLSVYGKYFSVFNSGSIKAFIEED